MMNFQSTDVMGTEIGTTFVSPKSGITLTVVGRSFGHADVEEVKAGNVDALEVRATADGRGFLRGTWHTTADGPEAESVWAEVWTLGGCQFHGCVDSESRKVVQVG